MRPACEKTMKTILATQCFKLEWENTFHQQNNKI